MPQQALRSSMLLYIASLPSRPQTAPPLGRCGWYTVTGARDVALRLVQQFQRFGCSMPVCSTKMGMSSCQAVDQVGDDHVFGAQAGRLRDRARRRVARAAQQGFGFGQLGVEVLRWAGRAVSMALIRRPAPHGLRSGRSGARPVTASPW
jgi:hypothetical protein